MPMLGRRRALALWGALLLTLALGGRALAQERIRLGPYETYERCIELNPGNSLRYSYEASAPLRFDIHFHAGEKTQYPVYRDGALSGSGVFTARQRNEYCVYWALRDEGSADLTFEIRTLRR
ncbi:MAG: hypothetical protein SCH98_16820 [Deferrisomatales bacterium]|nr:hypothetical protein [Deferrisomatales bacterium]